MRRPDPVRLPRQFTTLRDQNPRIEVVRRDQAWLDDHFARREYLGRKRRHNRNPLPSGELLQRGQQVDAVLGAPHRRRGGPR